MNGTDLRREREGRGLSLDDVAEGARIPRRYLVAMEDGDTKTLPPGPFLKSYRRQYLSYLGIDPDEIIEEEEELPTPSVDGSIEVEGPLPPYEPTSTGTIPRGEELPVMRLVLAGFLLTLTVVLALLVGSKVADRKDVPQPAVGANVAPQSVRIRAIEPVRVAVETDQSYHHNGTLEAGNTVDVESALPITVEVQDLSRVTITHNGERIEPLHNLSAGRRLVFIPDPSPKE